MTKVNDKYYVPVDEEVWEPIIGFGDKYEASSHGRIRQRLTKRISSQFMDTSTGYKKFHICLNGSSTQYRVHRIVAQTFIANPDNKPCVNHIDGNKTNNHKDNLEWCTIEENLVHAGRIGLMRYGEDQPRAKLKNCDIKEIRNMFELGFTNAAIGRLFKISETLLSMIRTNKIWKRA